MRVLITGASGFLGSEAALRWQSLGHRVGLLLRPGSRPNRLSDHENDAFTRCRFVSDPDIQAFVEQFQPDVVLHAACAYGRAGEGPLQLLDANVRLGLVILQALTSFGRPSHFLNMATVLAPEVNNYALSKNQFAAWGRSIATAHQGRGPVFINVELQHFYGPGDDRSKFTSHVLHSCHENVTSIDLTAGEQQRDFVYIEDVLDALTLIVTKRATFNAFDQVEVGSGTTCSIREFAEAVKQLTQSTTKLRFGAIPYRDSELMHSVADLTRLRSLGWRPSFTLDKGLSRYAEREFTFHPHPAGHGQT